MTTTINFRIDTKTKRTVQKNAEKLGLSLSSVISGYMHEFLAMSEYKIVQKQSATYIDKKSVQMKWVEARMAKYGSRFKKANETEKMRWAGLNK